MQRLWNDLMSDSDALVEGMVTKTPDSVLAAYRHKVNIAEAPMTAAMMRQHWTIERRSTRAILQSGRSNWAATVEQAYIELYRSCAWLERSRAPDRIDVEFARLPKLRDPVSGVYTPLVDRRCVSAVLNKSTESRGLLVFLVACERLLDWLPESLRQLGIKVPRSNVYIIF